MMEDVDGISRYIDPLVHQYTIIASRLHTEDVSIRPFAYSVDVFHHCNNQRHVITSNVLSISTTITSIPSIHLLYHTPIKFSTICSFSSVPAIPRQDNACHTLLVTVIPSPPITWISFDAVINYLAPILFRKGYNALQHIICKSYSLSFPLAQITSPDVKISLTTFTYILFSLQCQLLLLSTTKSSSSYLV